MVDGCVVRVVLLGGRFQYWSGRRWGVVVGLEFRDEVCFKGSDVRGG